MKYPELFITCVGSNMWGMNYPGSDIDRVIAFQVPTKSILEGRSAPKGLPQKKYFVDKQEYDDQYIEIGHMVNLAIKNNINIIWAITSPVVLQDSMERRLLYSIMTQNLSREVYGSVRGMAVSQFRDAMKEEGALDITKKMATAKRTLQFGIRILKLHRIEYTPISRASKDDIENALYDIDRAYEESTLPDHANEESFRTWLYRRRLDELEENENVI